MKNQNVKKYDLDNIMLSPNVYLRWLERLKPFAETIKRFYPDIKTKDIPDEYFFEVPNGRGFIKLRVKDLILRMDVERHEWSFINDCKPTIT